MNKQIHRFICILMIVFSIFSLIGSLAGFASLKQSGYVQTAFVFLYLAGSFTGILSKLLVVIMGVRYSLISIKYKTVLLTMTLTCLSAAFSIFAMINFRISYEYGNAILSVVNIIINILIIQTMNHKLSFSFLKEKYEMNDEQLDIDQEIDA